MIKAEVHTYEGFFGQKLVIKPVTIIGWFGDGTPKAVYIDEDGTMNYDYMGNFHNVRIENEQT